MTRPNYYLHDATKAILIKKSCSLKRVIADQK